MIKEQFMETSQNWAIVQNSAILNIFINTFPLVLWFLGASFEYHKGSFYNLLKEIVKCNIYIYIWHSILSFNYTHGNLH